MGEMLSMLLNCIQRVGLRKVKTCRALDFGWGTDPYSDFDEKKHAIFHMAGITRESGQFDKQRYVAFSPWDPQAKDMSYITDKTTCAQKWRELVEEYSRQMMWYIAKDIDASLLFFMHPKQNMFLVESSIGGGEGPKPPQHPTPGAGFPVFAQNFRF